MWGSSDDPDDGRPSWAVAQGARLERWQVREVNRCSPQHVWQRCHQTDVLFPCVPVAASGDVQTYQIRTAPTSTIAPGVVMASSPALPTQPAEEAARKREVRLMKNRHVHSHHFFPSQLCRGLECQALRSWSFLVMLWNALWRICFYLKMQSKDRHLLMLCVVTVKPWVKCQTHSVRYVNLVVAIRRKVIGEIFVWLQICSYKHQDELLFWSYSHVVSFPGFFPLASCMHSPCCWPTCALREFFLDCLTSFSCFGFSPPGAERLKQRLNEQLFLLTEILWSQ